MSEGRDPAIKLFGRNIPLSEEAAAAAAEEGDVKVSVPVIELPEEGEKDTCKEKAVAEVAKPMMGSLGDLSPKGELSSSGLSNSAEDAKKTSTETAKAVEEPMTKQDHKETDISGEDKVLKKPDKVLPCPRCNSMDTKFCYYNNYNVNQPRHFCKNCQRYWTAGGTMRNVPVGAGRRKNKHTASGYRQTVVTPDALASVHADGPDLTHHQALSCGSSAPKRPLKGNGTILTFGPDAPLCESMASILNLGEQKTSELGFSACGENREEPSCSSSVTSSKPGENGFLEDTQQNAMHSYHNGLQCFPGPPWAYPWNPAWNNVATAMAANGCSPEPVPCQENGILTQMSWTRPPMLIAPAFCTTFPFPFMAASFWGCMPSWPGGPWNLPWVGNSNGVSPSSSTSTSNCSGNGSPTLGKHSRDATLLGEEKMQKSLWIPKTLRIDDPDEAAKSSIFATLGIKPDECVKFKSFSSKTGKRDAADTTQVLHANPAALSRSHSFQEAT